VLDAAPDAEIVDVGVWPHPRRPPFVTGARPMRGLQGLQDDPAVGWFASSILQRGYPVEQEQATLDIVRSTISPRFQPG
jgi:hypothetical protein